MYHPPDGTYTVDAIAFDAEKKLATVRLLSYTEEGAGTPRYVLASPDCLAPRGTDDASDFLAHGRAYRPGRRVLRAGQAGDGQRGREGPLRADNFSRLMPRDRKTEDVLRSQVSELLTAASAASAQTEPTSSSGLRPGQRPRVVVFDVGQGDGILLLLPSGEAWLVDAYFPKSSYDRLLNVIVEATGQARIAKLMISHLHYDHLRDAQKVLTELSPSEVLVPKSLFHPSAAARNLLRSCAAAGVLRTVSDTVQYCAGGGTHVVCVSTASFNADELRDDPNNHAIVAGLWTPQTENCVLLSGDLEGRLLGQLVKAVFPLYALRDHLCEQVQVSDAEKSLRRINDLDFIRPAGSPRLAIPTRPTHKDRDSRVPAKFRMGLYKVTHHCSSTGDCDELLGSIEPTFATTSCARQNHYRHPHTPPRDRIDAITRRFGGRHAFTFREGDLCYQLDGTGGLQTCRQPTRENPGTLTGLGAVAPARLT